MMSKSKRFISALCALVVLISSYAGFTIPSHVNAAVSSNPVSSELQLDTKYDTFEKTDISVMSYNVLAHNSDKGTYENQTTRKLKVIKMVETYSPDLIGFQEAAVETALDWAAYLATELPKLGYSVYSLKGTSCPMTIGNGLVIAYKTSRFSEVSGTNFKGSKAYSNGSGRWFQWIMLKEKTTGQQCLFYNTHLHVGTAAADHTKREQESAELLNHIKAGVGNSVASRYPLFITGDFNADFTGSYAPCLNTLHNNSYIKDAATIADYTRFAYPKEEIDHVFVNPRYVDVKEYHVAVENVDGRRTSDHSPHIAYCSFKAHATINSTDISDKVFLAETSTNSYTFNFELGSRAGVDVYAENGTTLLHSGVSPNDGATSTFTATNLNKRTNRFIIKFFDGSNKANTKGNYVCTVEAIITNTSVSRPSFAPSGAVNSYFANDAYHVLVNDSTNTLSLSASGATFHTNADASGSSVTSVTLSAGRTVRYLKTTAGDIYPVYIYKQTTTANTDASVLYVDDDIGSATGTVAFYDGKDVLFIQGGTKGFGSVSAVASKVTDGATVYFAPGKYVANNVEFSKNVTLLGNNHNVSAVNKVKPNWSLASRKEESVIDGGLVFKNQSNISVTVKGFTFEGTSNYGPICIDDTSAEATRATHVQTLDIQNNIFTGGGNGSFNGASALRAYSGAQVKGLVKNNYFRCTINQKGAGADWVAGQTRGLSIKNANGLEFDSNYFRGYELLGDFTDEISSSVVGNINYAFTENRFEHCGTIRNAIKNIQSSSSANIVYYNNEVLRCGPGRRGGSLFFMDFDFNEGSLGNVCSNIAITMYGNRFTDCYRVFTIQRALGTGKGNLAQIKFRMNKNSFINPTEGDWDGHEFFIARLNFYTGTSKTANVDVSATWDLSDNYFTSPIFTDAATVDRIVNKATASVADFRKYRTDIPELNYIWNASKETNAIAPIKIDTNTFKAKEAEDYNTRADELAEILNKATGVTPENDEFIYDFNDDITGANIATDELSSIGDKVVTGTNSSSDTITITANKTLELKGRTSFYTENRWDSTGQVAFDLKTTSTLVDSKRSAFHFKFGHWLSVANRALQSSDFYSGSNIEGCFLTFATKANGGPTVKLFVYYKKADGTKAAAEYEFNNIVTSFTEFNTFKLVEAETGMLDLYANGKRFARLECYDSTSTYAMRAVATTADSYYDNIDVYAVENGTLVKKGNTITDTLVTKDTAIAFATSNSTVNDSTSATYGQTMEIDNLLITSSVDVIADDPTDDPTDDPADDPIVDTPGTITITKAQAGVNYNAYKMANVTYDKESDAYSYKVADGWEEFFAGTGDYAVVLDVYSVNGNVITKKTDADESKMPEIARLAVKYAQVNNITAAGSATADGNGTAVINVSSAGYYVVDSALGALCSVGTFNGSDGNVNIQEKNDVPTLQKFVKEEDTWQKANDESIGNTVEFKLLVYVAKGAKGYVVHDTLGDGFKAPTNVVVKQYSSYVNNGAATLTATYVSGNHYTVSVSGNSLTVTFNDNIIENVPVGNILEITYQASIDTDAAIDAANVNTAYMQYGETNGLQTASVVTNTYVWSFGIHKYYGNDIGLPGASFELYDTNPVGNDSATPMQFVYDAQKDTYRLASQADIDDVNIPTTSILVSLVTGDYRIQGLDSATYYLVEKEAPDGFNKLGAPIAVTIASSQVDNAETQLNKLVTAKQGLADVAIMDGDVIPVLNQTGILLPETGGYASVFVAVGCMMVMSMGILLVVRKRMTKVIYIKNDDYYEDFED